MAMEAAKEADSAGSPGQMVAELAYDFSRSGNLRSEARQLVGRFLDWWREPAVMQIPHGVGPCSYRERQFAEARYTLSLVVRVHRESVGYLSGEEGPGESDVLAPIVRQVAEITRIDATSFRETSGVDCRCTPSGRPATPDPVERPPLPPLPRRPPTGGAPRDANPPPPEPGPPPGDEGNYSPEFLPVSDEQANPALQDFIVEGTPQSGPVARRGRNVPSLTLTEALMPATPAAAQAFWPARRSAAGPPPAIGTSWTTHVLAARLPREAAENQPSSGRANRLAVVATGLSSGEAFRIEVYDASAGRDRPLRLPEGTVLRPFSSTSAARRTSPVREERLAAYCLDFPKAVPAPGVVYGIAAREIQARYRPLRDVLRAARQLTAAGRLHPDSDPAAYANAIKQWAVWSRIEKWDERTFAEKLVERTRETARQLKRPWIPAMEAQLRAAAPNRWRDISAVLEEAKTIEAVRP